MVASFFWVYVLVVLTRYWSKLSKKEVEAVLLKLQEGATLGPGCYMTGCAAGAVSSTRNCVIGYKGGIGNKFHETIPPVAEVVVSTIYYSHA